MPATGYTGHAAKGTTMKTPRNGYEHNHLTRLQAVFARVYANKEWTGPWRLVRLLADWPEIVGTEVARLTSPAFFRRETLWLYVQDSAWMHHLQYIKPDLIGRINTYLADQPIGDLRWQLQPQPAPPRRQRSSSPGAVDPEREQSFHRMTESIANPDSREALRRLWRTFAVADE